MISSLLRILLQRHMVAMLSIAAYEWASDAFVAATSLFYTHATTTVIVTVACTLWLSIPQTTLVATMVRIAAT